ncbi:MAG: hypothetical protein QOG13_3 [Sphingomonadales bacterium]|jgi:hypothetical protein|nr:hypothetical protein [Sphingomonadales bacterium]MEA3042663.1 hypothetical protein [Sphingomonadales bacterium]
MQGQQSPYSYLIPILVIGIVLIFRFRAMGKARRLRLERLWVVPALYLALTILLFWEMTPHGLGWLWAALAFAAGGAIGWYRGAAMKISVDPETHALNQTSSPLALLLILALVAVRFAIRAGAGNQDIALVTDCLVAFALGLLSLQRLEMFLRGSRLLNEARAN